MMALDLFLIIFSTQNAEVFFLSFFLVLLVPYFFSLFVCYYILKFTIHRIIFDFIVISQLVAHL